MRHERPEPVRVVIVDDHPLVRTSLRALLEAFGHFAVVGEAEDGMTGVDLVRHVHPDLVLMDVNMPGMGGVEATRQIKSRELNTKVVGISIHDEEYIRHEMLDAGAAAVVDKACPVEELHRTLEAVAVA